MDFGLSGKCAVVTGGASGIGLACVRLLVSAGAKVAIADRDFDAAESRAYELGAYAVPMDVGDEVSIDAAVQHIHRLFTNVDVLVNCAGVLQRTLPPEELTISEWDRVSRIDLRGTYLCCRAFGPAMARRGQGSIVNIASVAGMCSGPLHSYAPAKAGVINLTECLAGEWGPRGVRVNTVSPGFTMTPALEKGIATRTLDGLRLAEAAALGRLVAAEDIAKAVLFLASELAASITGVNLPVDAGYLVARSWSSYGGLRHRNDTTGKSAPTV
ncbi:SDR family NAD(P)-dependent oxidoreductase [Ralstonia syzygii]|uniref:Putative short-chain dehydrogenase/reductase n=1 Tax=Ralstonia syzygii R24 TaxID=907261 RepID=G3A7H3_9RALS|nr:SDR family oxidoreductase [Ralstonia syzygii]CCA86445.1 putative short-chain dehydrogenase/reductase [Ralstonia syzygii R24]